MKDKIKTKKQEVQTEDPQVEVLKSQLARALADYDNLRKRADEERVSFIKYASRNILQSLLPVLDTFEAAQKHLKDIRLNAKELVLPRIFIENGQLFVRGSGDENSYKKFLNGFTKSEKLIARSAAHRVAFELAERVKKGEVE